MPLFEDETLEGAIRKATAGLRPDRKQDLQMFRGRATSGEEVRYTEPDDNTRRRIGIAIGRARHAMSSALLIARSNGRDQLFNRYFGAESTSPDQDISTVAREIQTTRNYAQALRSSQVGFAAPARGGVRAEVLQDRTIVVYPPFISDKESQNARTIIHEILHITTQRQHYGDANGNAVAPANSSGLAM